MVCPRCLMVVREVLQSMNIAVQSVSLGRVETEGDVDGEVLAELNNRLREVGFEIVSGRDAAVVEQIKAKVIELARNGGNDNLSTELAASLGADYSHLSRLFTAHEGRTIEKFYIAHKIERVKELLGYNELSLKEIAYQLGYSSTAHLSRQFKQVTGVTPTEYRSGSAERKAITDV
ncbi:MAG: helix-turn-helix domain-containing protein [Muribaculaceae bacterium]